MKLLPKIVFLLIWFINLINPTPTFSTPEKADNKNVEKSTTASSFTHAELETSPEGREFLGCYERVSRAYLLLSAGKIGFGVFKNSINLMKSSWTKFKTSNFFANYKTLNPTNATKLESEVKNVIEEADKLDGVVVSGVGNSVDITNFYTINKALDSKNLVLQHNLMQYSAGASIDEVSAIHRYTVNNFELTSAAYNGGYSTVQQSWVNLIESGLNKMRSTKSFTGTVYRGSNLTSEHLQLFLDAWQTTSKNITIPPFQSTSKLESIADDFINFNTAANKTEVMFEIQSKTGIYIDDISDYGKNLVDSRHSGRLAQEEVILYKNGKFRIDNLSTITKSDGTIRYIIEMTEL
jgi:hypothetical protein